MENKLVTVEDLKYFHNSLLGNEENAKGLLGIKEDVFEELSLSAPEIGTPELSEDVFASTLIPTALVDTVK